MLNPVRRWAHEKWTSTLSCVVGAHKACTGTATLRGEPFAEPCGCQCHRRRPAWFGTVLVPATDDVDALQDLIRTMCLYVDWRYVTRQMTTEQKELFADIVDAGAMEGDIGADRWWRQPTPVGEGHLHSKQP